MQTQMLLACSVCWGAAQDPVVHGTKLSIVFLLGLTYLLLGGGVGMVLIVRRKALRAAAAGGPAPSNDEHAVAPTPSASKDSTP
ncbi:MAG TPA: hypothetical protein VGS57_01835 [Thermoanaerobaculia bacterium]|jgi:hypothetical protein|nr:hypothetical protein [Thermoanaerobaculia bacterium]